MRTQGEAPSKVFARRLAEERRRRNWTAQRLADETERLGAGISRSTIAKVESGARGDKGVTLDEAAVLAVALDVPLPLLFLPIDTGGSVALTPTTVVEAWRAFEWMASADPLPGSATILVRGEYLLLSYLVWRDAHAAANEALNAVKGAEFEGNTSKIVRSKAQLREALRALSDAIEEMGRAGVPDRTNKAFHTMMKEAGIR